MISRRQFFIGGLAGFGGLLMARENKLSHAQQGGQEKKVKGTSLVLLGTMGGSRIVKGRAQNSQIIVANDLLYVVDCGYGVARQLVLAGYDLRKLKNVFITHHHDDHNLDFGNLVHLALMSGIKEKVNTYCPYPLKKMGHNYIEMFDYTRHQSVLGITPLQNVWDIHEVQLDGPVMEDENVKVSCVRVIHPPVPAFAFRFDTKDRSITISGDTAYCPELISLAKGSDVLVHEVTYKPALEKLGQRLPQYKNLVKFLLESHTTAEDVGKVAQKAEVKTLVLTHFVPGDDPTITDEMWVEAASKFFKGKIIAGKDFMTI